MKRSLLILLLSFCFAASASAGNCRGRIINPITDVCWSCVFPIKLGGVTLSSGNNADPETDANRLCLCASGANITVGLNMSFWEPLRTAEVVRTPYCFPSLGGMELNVGIRAPAHGRTPNKSTSAQRSSFYQVHWYFTPWLFILEVLLDTKRQALMPAMLCVPQVLFLMLRKPMQRPARTAPPFWITRRPVKIPAEMWSMRRS